MHLVLDLKMQWFFVLFLLMPVNTLQSELSEPQNINSRGPCTDSNHLFLAPGVLTAGGTNRACVSRFDPEGPARMLVTLDTDGELAATASRELPPGDGGCIDLSVPQKPNTKGKLTVSLWYPEAKCSWERQLTVMIASGRVVVVHTEKARYRPGDTLRARLIALKADLTPSHGLIDEVWVEGPRGAWEGARAAQWSRVRTRMGVAQVQHELDALAPAGRWTIRAKLADGSQGSAVFWVGNYELPPFQLSVRHAPRVLRTSERLVWTVCVRYPWTEAVEGMLVIRIRGAGGTTVGQEVNSSIKTVVRIKAPRACHRHAAAARRIGLNGTNPPDVVVADFSFQEDGTRIWQNTTVVSDVIDKPVTLEFLRRLRAVISPGLPYKLKVKATRWDDKPAANERIKVCRSRESFSANFPHTSSNDSCHDAVTDDRGLARVTFTANNDGSSYYSFQASLQNDSNVSAAPLNIAARYAGSVHASLGTIKPDANSARTYVPLFINLKSVAQPLTVHFVVVTRGGIIYRWGATTQCPQTSSSDYIPTTSRNSQCYYNNNVNEANNQVYSEINKTLANNNPNDPDSLLDRHLLRIMLPIKVTHQMCPDSNLVAYFYYNGELVSASKQFEMDECFSNKVEATWLSRQTAPGSTASLRLSTPGPALCALSVLDSAAKGNRPAPSIKEVVMTSLKRLMDCHRNLTEYEAAGPCFNNITELPTNSLELTAAWLASAGVRVAGGDVNLNQRCVSPPAPLMEDATVPRSDFSEAWLWRLAAVGTNGTAIISAKAPDSISRFEASAVCLARTGIAVSPPAVLQVFREFFIHADSPKRLRRGDATIIRYRLFNYLYEPLSVQIQILTDAHLEGPVEHVESACVSARASVARRVEIKATVSGDARLSIRAKSVRDGNCANGTVARTPVSDEVIINITVDPEGVPMQEHKSILLCARGSPESSRSEVSWSWPPIQPVPGTDALTVWAVGDVKGPLLFDADTLVTLPRGCGEQNMARLATNLLALTQLDPSSSAAATAKEHVARGFIRQLQYIHPAGGFSAFGASDASPSTWLTAFSLRYLLRAHKILNPGLPIPPSLERAEKWLLSQQMENGCFRNEGQVFHRELRGGLSEEGEIASVALTAYVITAFVESTTPLSTRVLHNTLSCLRALPPMKTRSPTRVYAHALLGYAFMRLRSYEDELRKTNEASLLWDRKEPIGAGLKEDEELRELLELLQMAKRSGDYVWWETSSLSTSIEATAYALLALSRCPPRLRGTSCAGDARAAVRWLSAHRNHAGGFLSTQDTLVALEALTSWSSVQPSASSNLTVKIRSGSDVKKVLIQPDMKVPDITRIAGKSEVDVTVEGTGCALIQATRSYNTMSSDVSKDKLLTVQASVHTDGTFDCDVNGTSCFCAAVVEVCVTWTGSFPEMAVVEATLPPSFGADAHKLYAQLQETNTMLRRIELTPNGGRTTLYLSARDGASAGGHRCFEVHSVGPRARTKPAHVRVIDYYTPTINDTQMYTIPEDCPPRIAHTSPEYLPSDNLFNKARSLNDDEILITHEFSFEDIPEGIPLDDPLYDLNRDDVAYLSKYNEVDRSAYHDFEKKTNEEDGVEPDDEKVNMHTKKEMDDKLLNHANAKNIGHDLKQEQIDENIEVNTYLYRDKPNTRVTGKHIEISSYDNDRNSLRQRYTENNLTGKNFNQANFRQSRNFFFRPSTDQIRTYPGDLFYYYSPRPRRIDKQHFNINPNIQYYEAVETRPIAQQIHNEYERHFNTSRTKDKNTRPIYLDKQQENHYKANVAPTMEQAENNDRMGIPLHKEINTNPFIVPKEPLKYYDHPVTQPSITQNDKANFNNQKTDENKYTTMKPFNLVLTNHKTDIEPEISKPAVNPDMSLFDNNNPDARPVKDSEMVVADAETNFSRFPLSNPSQGPREPEAAPQVDNPNLSSFHVIDSERDLEVPSGLEGPVPAIALPPQNFVAVAPPPGFQSPFIQGGFPRGLPPPGLYTFPYRPHSYYRHMGYSPGG